MNVNGNTKPTPSDPLKSVIFNEWDPNSPSQTSNLYKSIDDLQTILQGMVEGMGHLNRNMHHMNQRLDILSNDVNHLEKVIEQTFRESHQRLESQGISIEYGLQQVLSDKSSKEDLLLVKDQLRKLIEDSKTELTATFETESEICRNIYVSELIKQIGNLKSNVNVKYMGNKKESESRLSRLFDSTSLFPSFDNDQKNVKKRRPEDMV